MKIRISRTVIIILIFVIVLSVFVVKLMGYQLVNGESYREKADKTTESTETIAAPRGEIVDRYGRTIATNRVGFTVTFSKAFLSRSTENGIILQVTKILKADGELWNDTLPISQTAPYEFNTADTTNIKRLFKITGIDNDISANAVMNKLVERYDVDTSLSPADIRTIVGIRYEMEARDFSTSNPFECASDVSMTTVTKISERSLELPGVGIGQKPIRVYTNGTLAPHVIGTISSIFAEEYAALAKKHYAMNDLIGRGGIEQAMESYLRGTDGERTIELNKNGKVTSETTTKAAKPGDTVVLTLDSRLQEQLQAALPATIKQIAQSAKGNKEKGAEAMSGAAVVLNVQTGEVLAMATYPSYDLNSYYKDYSALLKQAGNPLVNRCITGVYRPGSTFKPVVAVSALMCGAITSSTTFFCPGYLVKFGMTFHCDAPHGTENVIGGLKDSCNVFFYNTGWLAGITRIDATAKALGLGQKTGIEIGGESTGTLSGPAEKAASGRGAWNPGDTLQSSIGQFDNLYTPLQLADYISTIVNGGTRYQVHVVKKVLSYDGSTVILDNSTPKVLSKLDISSSVLSTVMEGLHQVIEEGTGQQVFSGYSMPVGGKTGTAQVPGGYYNGLFLGYAPADNPQIAVAVVVEHGYHGNQTSPVAKDVFNNYFYYTNKVSSPVYDSTLLQ